MTPKQEQTSRSPTNPCTQPKFLGIHGGIDKFLEIMSGIRAEFGYSTQNDQTLVAKFGNSTYYNTPDGMFPKCVGFIYNIHLGKSPKEMFGGTFSLSHSKGADQIPLVPV